MRPHIIINDALGEYWGAFTLDENGGLWETGARDTHGEADFAYAGPAEVSSADSVLQGLVRAALEHIDRAALEHIEQQS